MHGNRRRTVLTASISAPFFSSSWAASFSPSLATQISGVLPFCAGEGRTQ